MPKRAKGRPRSIESRKSLYGLGFILPWMIGVLVFFLIPIGQSLWFSLSEVEATGGLKTTFIGLENYRSAYVYPNYQVNLDSAIQSFIISMPIIVLISLVLAMVLNQKFRGRLIFRSMFFLPVIVASGVVMRYLTQRIGKQQPIIQLSTDVSNEYVAGGFDFAAILNALNLPENITNMMATYIGMIFNLIWSSGIPIVLFLAGLQTIPDQLYEASRVEGATAWEEFWYVTLPMLGNTILLVIMFTSIELLTQSNNGLIDQAYNLMNNTGEYGISAAMLWLFYAVVGVILALITVIYTRLCLKRWQ